jgi:hypothetical protein
MTVLTRREARTAEAFFLTCKSPASRTTPKRDPALAEKKLTAWIDADPDHALDVLTRLDPHAIGVSASLVEDFARRARYQVYADYPFPGRPWLSLTAPKEDR